MVQRLFAVQKAVRRATGCPGTVVVARWLFEEVRGSRRFVHRRVEPGSFVVVRVLASESALSAAGPCVSRRHVPPGYEVPTEPKGSLFFFSFHLGFCVCVS